MANLKLDLHPIYNDSKKIDQSLHQIFQDAISSKIKKVEIIPGKGSGQLKKKVLRFLEKCPYKTHFKQIDKDSKNHGRIFVFLKY